MGGDVRTELEMAHTPRERLAAIVYASFGRSSFKREAVSAWLNFYTLALKSTEARRLLYIYRCRLYSNLVYNLRPLIGDHAPEVAHRIAGLIDGLYLRYVLDETMKEGREGAEHVLRAIEAECNMVKTGPSRKSSDIVMSDLAASKHCQPSDQI